MLDYKGINKKYCIFYEHRCVIFDTAYHISIENRHGRRGSYHARSAQVSHGEHTVFIAV